MDKKARFAIRRVGTVTLQAVAYIMLLSAPALAGDPLHHRLGCPVPSCIGKWCRDDYCPKREPCVDVSLCFGRDDYCIKKAPFVCAPLSLRCDDYCKKCPPKVCRAPLSQYLKCGSSCRSNGCANCQPLRRGGYVAKSGETQQHLIANGKNQLAEEPLPAKPQRLAPVIVRAPDRPKLGS